MEALTTYTNSTLRESRSISDTVREGLPRRAESGRMLSAVVSKRERRCLRSEEGERQQASGRGKGKQPTQQAPGSADEAGEREGGGGRKVSHGMDVPANPRTKRK